MTTSRHQHRNSEFNLAAADVRRLVAAAPTQRDRLLLQLLALTGIRRAEARLLQRTDVDLERGRLLIRGKGQKQRLVFIPPELRACLSIQLLKSKADHLFPGRDGVRPISLRNINYIVGRVSLIAGIQHPNPRHSAVTPHLLRHSLARNWKRAGGSMESLQRILGHASLKTTMDVYGTESISDTEANYRALVDRILPPA